MGSISSRIRCGGQRKLLVIYRLERVEELFAAKRYSTSRIQYIEGLARPMRSVIYPVPEEL